eukprot:TRINITY_DN2477_c0_g1_i33.p2 TRINITY_DN2477_c0_g1~~TRINITY_DN2477_c0_g1_i33.p2  ORF type:complete len:143 (-),score=37.38 TRINITY_DN2477_c0_g1_i33:440-868(-)
MNKHRLLLLKVALVFLLFPTCFSYADMKLDVHNTIQVEEYFKYETFHKLLIGSNHYELAAISKFMAIIILLVLAVIMIFVLLTLLNVIIMSEGRGGREDDEGGGKNWTRKILNLVLCRSPVEKQKPKEDAPQTEEQDALQED